MDYFIRFANLPFLYFLIPMVFILAVYKLKLYKQVKYKFSLAQVLDEKNASLKTTRHKNIPFTLKLMALFLMSLLIAQPQLVDKKSKVNVEGIDIILALDSSASMQLFDDLDDRRSRFEIAKEEAIRFVNKRENDPIGLVIFGLGAFSRCPLTLDKNILCKIIEDLFLGFINPNGTFLSTALLMSANRLKSSKAKSKIIILLTDGGSQGENVSPKDAVDIAKKLGIKVYTIGIGDEEGGYYVPFGNMVTKTQSNFNRPLLMSIANETGGQFFHAKNAADMRRIYDEIDRLEKTELEVNIYTNYYEFFVPLLILVICILILHLVLTTFVWFSL